MDLEINPLFLVSFAKSSLFSFHLNFQCAPHICNSPSHAFLKILCWWRYVCVRIWISLLMMRLTARPKDAKIFFSSWLLKNNTKEWIYGLGHGKVIKSKFKMHPYFCPFSLSFLQIKYASLTLSHFCGGYIIIKSDNLFMEAKHHFANKQMFYCCYSSLCHDKQI